MKWKKQNYKNKIIKKYRERYTNEELDVTLKEIKPNIDEIDIDNCLEIDEDINEDIIKNKTI